MKRKKTRRWRRDTCTARAVNDKIQEYMCSLSVLVSKLGEGICDDRLREDLIASIRRVEGGIAAYRDVLSMMGEIDTSIEQDKFGKNDVSFVDYELKRETLDKNIADELRKRQERPRVSLESYKMMTQERE